MTSPRRGCSLKTCGKVQRRPYEVGPGGLREFGCGVTSRHVRRCCRNRGGLLRKQKLDGKSMHYDHRQQAPRGRGAIPSSDRAVLLCLLETDKRPRVNAHNAHDESRMFDPPENERPDGSGECSQCTRQVANVRCRCDQRTRHSMLRLGFCPWLAARGFALSQRQATSKDSIDIFVRFPLASSAGRSVHTTCPPARQPPRFAEKWFTNSQVGLVSGTLYP